MGTYHDKNTDGTKTSVHALHFMKSKQIFITKRAKTPIKGHSTPVGGKVEAFETPLESAIRETYEETGLEVRTMRYRGILTETSRTQYNWINYIYTSDMDSIGPPECNEGILAWISFDELSHLSIPKTDLHIDRFLMNEKHFSFDAKYDDQLVLLSMTEEIEGVKPC